MAAVLIKCPSTGRPVPTGFEMPWATFETAEMSENAFQCSACGQTHVWDKADSWLEGQPAGPASGPH